MVDYTHAGTVEYLFLEETGEFFFLELNPRLQAPHCAVHLAIHPTIHPALPWPQVEHPVTEGITGANLPSLQLIVAMGIDLTKLPPSMSVNKFLIDVNNPSQDNPFDRVNGHTIAVRITAENAADGWKPTVGAIDQARLRSRRCIARHAMHHPTRHPTRHTTHYPTHHSTHHATHYPVHYR